MKILILSLLFLGVAARPDPRRPWRQDRPPPPPFGRPPQDRDRPPMRPDGRDPWRQDRPRPPFDDWPVEGGEDFLGPMGEDWPAFDDFPMSSGWGMEDDELPMWPEEKPPCGPGSPGNRPPGGDTNPGQNGRGDKVTGGRWQQERSPPPPFRQPPQTPPFEEPDMDFGRGMPTRGQGFDRVAERPGFNRRPPRAGPSGRRPAFAGGARPERPQGGGRFERPPMRDPASRPPRGPFGGRREPFEGMPFGGRPLSPDEQEHREFVPIFKAENITVQNASVIPLKEGENVYLLPRGGRRGSPGKPGQKPPQDLYGYYGYGHYGFQPYLKLAYNPTATPTVSFEYGITQLLPGFMKDVPENETGNDEEIPGPF